MSKRGTILVLHFVGQMPLAGIAWQAMHYLVGLERLGYDVWYIEDGGANPYDPRVASVMMGCDYNVAYLRRAMESHGLGGRWAYWDAINDEWHGLPRDAVQHLYAEADGLINLCGATRLREEHLACPVRIMVDSDPVYEQIKYAQADPAARAYLDAHTHFFSYGENLGSDGLPGAAVRDRLAPDPAAGRLSICGPQRMTKGAALRRSPPGKTRARTSNSPAPATSGRSTSISCGFSICRDAGRGLALPWRWIRPMPRCAATVTRAGWSLVDPGPISAGMDAYREFVAQSRGEFTVAKDIYVRPNSGWFSDRSACYLAAGRPVVTMRTGFGKFVPGRPRPVRIRHRGRGACRHRRDRRRLPRPQPGGAGDRPRVFRRRPCSGAVAGGGRVMIRMRREQQRSL